MRSIGPYSVSSPIEFHGSLLGYRPVYDIQFTVQISDRSPFVLTILFGGCSNQDSSGF